MADTGTHGICRGASSRALPTTLTVNILGHVDIRVTQNVTHNHRPCDLAQRVAGRHSAACPENALYRSRSLPNLRKVWLQTFAGKWDFGWVRAMSAIDMPMLASTGVKR
jgi:hypothetical protein